VSIQNRNRRALLQGALIASGAALVSARAASTDAQVRVLTAQTSWSSPPVQARVTEGIANLPGGARLWYWDTGGDAEPVVLLHPASGHGAIWEYQQPALVAAGYRVIGYSRRGYFRSEVAASEMNPNQAGTGSGDLHELIEHLKIDRFHLVGSAAGGFIVPDYALSHPEKLLSLTIACSLGGVQDEQYQSVTRALMPRGFRDLPVEFREIGPSYRAANPTGVARWSELHQMNRAEESVRQPTAYSLTWSAIETIRTPALLITGDADLYMPPARLREFARHVPGAEAVVVSESGHSAYWEQPVAFNRSLLEFFNKHRARGK
jgi:pimeloyl-ACP methyl ester carboxylesterase